MSTRIRQLKEELKKLANKEQAQILAGFFKTGKGEYGEGDIFLGIKVPEQRKIAKKYDLSLAEIQQLLNSRIHDHRLVALFILINKYKNADEEERRRIFNFYLENTDNINNWDLVDLSSRDIIGNFLLNNEREILYKLAESGSLWEKRIAIIATYEFIRNNQFKDTFKISQILLNDEHDLIHKAVGWMLREIGKRNEQEEERFLKKFYKKMPRTMLIYAIERFEEGKRKKYLNGKM